MARKFAECESCLYMSNSLYVIPCNRCERFNNEPPTEYDSIGEQEKKPPLGVVPRHIHRWQRIAELTRALCEYAHQEIVINTQDRKRKLMTQWSNELKQLLEENEDDTRRD